MAVDGIRGVVEGAIQKASAATGVDFSFLLGTANRESGLRPTAKAPTSSAAGLFQFTEQTWLATLKKYGGKHGYARYADMIYAGADGRYRVAGGDDARKAVMDLRYDPRLSALMAGELTSDNAAYIRGRIGREPTSGELYAAHFLGPKGSAQLIQAASTSPGAIAANLFPDAAAANRTIFYRGGRPVTVAELYANLTRGIGAGVGPTAPSVTPDQGFLQYARGRNADLVQQQQTELVDFILRGPQSPGRSTGTSLPSSMLSSEMLKVLSDAKKAGR